MFAIRSRRGFKAWGPFRVAVVNTRRGDGKYWTTYILQVKPWTELSAGPDRFTVKFETKMRDRP